MLLGVGAMLVGGIFALFNMRVALMKGLSAGVMAFREAAANGGMVKRSCLLLILTF